MRLGATKAWQLGCAIVPLVASLVLQGCAGGVSPGDVSGYDGLLGQGNYAGAAQMAQQAGRIGPDGRSENLLWTLNAGAALTYSGEGARVIPVLDSAEEMMRRRDVGTLSDGGQYRAKTYDGVMVNAYKALAALQAGQSDVARTELLRADERQNRAEQEFRAESEAAAARAQSSGLNMQQSLAAGRGNAEYQQAVRDMSNYGGYAPFINPFATYLTGLYFLNAADANRERARNAFQRVRGIVGATPLLNGDIALAQSGRAFSPKTWVIFENGQGSTLTAYNLTFPVPIVAGRRSGAGVATVAMPRLRENAPAAGGLLVGEEQARTSVVGNFDYVMRSEFARRYPSIMAAAVGEAVLKIAMQNAAAQDKSGIASLVAAVASNISSADTRSWSALPKDFQVARIEAPRNGIVRLRTDRGGELGEARVPADASSIVYVKAMRAGAPAAIQVLRF